MTAGEASRSNEDVQAMKAYVVSCYRRDSVACLKCSVFAGMQGGLLVRQLSCLCCGPLLGQNDEETSLIFDDRRIASGDDVVRTE